MKIHLSITNSPQNIEMLAEALTFLATNPEAEHAAVTIITEHTEIPRQPNLSTKVEDNSLWYWGGDDGKTYIMDLPDDWREQSLRPHYTDHELMFCTTDAGNKVHVHKPGSDRTWCGRWMDDRTAQPKDTNTICRNCVRNQQIHGDQEVADYISSLL